MGVERRGFFRMVFAYSAGTALWMSHPAAGYSQLAAVAVPLEEAAPRLFQTLLKFGGTVLSSAASGFLTDWLKSKFATPAPPPQTFHEQFNPPVHIQVPNERQTFRQETKVPERSLLVNSLPHVVPTENARPTEYTHVNVPEMDELSNTDNPFLYREQCGCLVRLPLNSGARRPPMMMEKVDFMRWAYSGGVPGPAEQLESRLRLDYVRDFCRCDNGEPLRGFAFRDGSYRNGNVARFAITSV